MRISRITGTTFLLAYIVFGSGCLPIHDGEPARIESLPIELRYEDGANAKTIRISNGFFIDDQTIGWMEIHYFTDLERRPHPDLLSAYWLIEQNIETLETRETLYLASPVDRRGPLTTVRYSDGRLFQLASRHYSIVFEQGASYLISPGNRIQKSNETMKHFPMDYADGKYLYGEWVRDEERRHPTQNRLALVEPHMGDQSGWTSDLFPQELFNLHEAYESLSGPVARLVTPELIVLLWRKKVEDPEMPGKGMRDLEFTRVAVPSGKMEKLGTVRMPSSSYSGWDAVLLDDKVRVAIGHFGLDWPDGSVARRAGAVVADLHEGRVVDGWSDEVVRFERLLAPALSPDGRHVIGRTHATRSTGDPQYPQWELMQQFIENRQQTIQNHVIHEIPQ